MEAASGHGSSGRVLAKIKRYQQDGKWCQERPICSAPAVGTGRHEPVCSIPLRRGGTLKIYPNRIQENRTTEIKHEVLQSGLFRQYQVQAQDEPRLHFLLHERATSAPSPASSPGVLADDKDDLFFRQSEQPGYKYANITMKARPLSLLPKLSDLSKELALESHVKDWNIGVNPVLYRDQQDKMGYHADDDQDEQVILCLVVSSPCRESRRVSIIPKGNKKLYINGDEMIELCLRPGDAYEMDGEMQLHYKHGVPGKQGVILTKEQAKEYTASRTSATGGAFAGAVGSASQRMVVVFRAGREVFVKHDSGDGSLDLTPKEPKIRLFGNDIPQIEEGGIYSRVNLYKWSAHLSPQQGISGSRVSGCDAIIVSGLREDKLGEDELFSLMYAAESAKGAKSVVTSYRQQLPIRIFRSSIYTSPWQAYGEPLVKNQTFYRYDGLYRVTRYDEPIFQNGPYQFFLVRLDENVSMRNGRVFLWNKNRMVTNITVLNKEEETSSLPAAMCDKHALEEDRMDDGCFWNRIPNSRYVGHCERLGTIAEAQQRWFMKKYFLFQAFFFEEFPRGTMTLTASEEQRKFIGLCTKQYQKCAASIPRERKRMCDDNNEDETTTMTTASSTTTISPTSGEDVLTAAKVFCKMLHPTNDKICTWYQPHYPPGDGVRVTATMHCNSMRQKLKHERFSIQIHPPPTKTRSTDEVVVENEQEQLASPALPFGEHEMEDSGQVEATLQTEAMNVFEKAKMDLSASTEPTIHASALQENKVEGKHDFSNDDRSVEKMEEWNTPDKGLATHSGKHVGPENEAESDDEPGKIAQELQGSDTASDDDEKSGAESIPLATSTPSHEVSTQSVSSVRRSGRQLTPRKDNDFVYEKNGGVRNEIQEDTDERSEESGPGQEASHAEQAHSSMKKPASPSSISHDGELYRQRAEEISQQDREMDSPAIHTRSHDRESEIQEDADERCEESGPEQEPLEEEQAHSPTKRHASPSSISNGGQSHRERAEGISQQGRIMHSPAMHTRSHDRTMMGSPAMHTRSHDSEIRDAAVEAEEAPSSKKRAAPASTKRRKGSDESKEKVSPIPSPQQAAEVAERDLMHVDNYSVGMRSRSQDERPTGGGSAPDAPALHSRSHGDLDVPNSPSSVPVGQSIEVGAESPAVPSIVSSMDSSVVSRRRTRAAAKRMDETQLSAVDEGESDTTVTRSGAAKKSRKVTSNPVSSVLRSSHRKAPKVNESPKSEKTHSVARKPQKRRQSRTTSTDSEDDIAKVVVREREELTYSLRRSRRRRAAPAADADTVDAGNQRKKPVTRRLGKSTATEADETPSRAATTKRKRRTADSDDDNLQSKQEEEYPKRKSNRVRRAGAASVRRHNEEESNSSSSTHNARKRQRATTSLDDAADTDSEAEEKQKAATIENRARGGNQKQRLPRKKNHELNHQAAAKSDGDEVSPKRELSSTAKGVPGGSPTLSQAKKPSVSEVSTRAATRRTRTTKTAEDSSVSTPVSTQRLTRSSARSRQ